MFGYDLLSLDNKTMLDDGLFSTPFILTDKTGKTYGAKDINSKLKCFAPFIGMSISFDDMTQVVGDSAEVTLNMKSILPIKPEKGCAIEIYFPQLESWVAFIIAEIHLDRMLGWYHLKLTLEKPQTESRKITRISIGGY